MGFDQQVIIERLTLMIPMIIALSVHEYAHAWAAWKLGDDTARLLGRLTINPLAHIDPIGTLLLPLLGIPFGWAKPVPVNPMNFNRRVSMTTGMMLTAVAGPVSNVLQALIAVIAIVLIARFKPEAARLHNSAFVLLYIFVRINVVLALFNMLPIPPLDGSRVVDGLMPRRFRPAWSDFCRMAPMLLILVLVLPSFLGFSLFKWPLDAVDSLIQWLVMVGR